MKTFKESMGLYNQNKLDEGDIQNLADLIQDITNQLITALKKNDQRKVVGLYKNLGQLIK
jgi:hypothetical protein